MCCTFSYSTTWATKDCTFIRLVSFSSWDSCLIYWLTLEEPVPGLLMWALRERTQRSDVYIWWAGFCTYLMEILVYSSLQDVQRLTVTLIYFFFIHSWLDVGSLSCWTTGLPPILSLPLEWRRFFIHSFNPNSII